MAGRPARPQVRRVARPSGRRRGPGGIAARPLTHSAEGTVSFVNDGLTLYFGCGARSQKADNIRRDGRVSITVNLPYANWNEIRSLSLGGVAALVTDPAEIDRVMARMTTKFPQVADFALTSDAQMALVRVTPQVVSVLDYAKGFGHTDLVHLCDAGTSASSATAAAPPATAP